MIDIPLSVSIPSNNFVTLQALVNGTEASGCDIVQETDGRWHIKMNTIAFANGPYTLQLRLNGGRSFADTQIVNGPLTVASVSNAITLPPLGFLHTDTLYIEALVNVPADSYTIDMYDANTNYLTTLSGTVDNGTIGTSWDLTDGNGNTIGSGPLQAKFNLYSGNSTFDHATMVWLLQTSHIHGNGFVAVANGGTNTTYPNNGYIIQAMDDILEANFGLTSPDYNMLPIGYNQPYAGMPFIWYAEDSATYNTLSDALKSGGTVAFYFNGHGNVHSISTSTNGGQYSEIRAEQVAYTFGNLGSEAMLQVTNPPPSLANSNAFRLVILDSCDTYSKRWSDAWGIPIFKEVTKNDYGQFGLDANAFVGWADDVKHDYSTFAGTCYADCMATLVAKWQSGLPLKKCFAFYNFKIHSYNLQYTDPPLFINLDQWKISGCKDLTTFDR